MPSKRYICIPLCLALTLIGVAVVFAYQKSSRQLPATPAHKEKVSGEFTWIDEAYRPHLRREWNTLAATARAGFGAHPVAEKTTDGCALDNPDAYLRATGGLCEKGYWLEAGRIFKKKINSADTLREVLAPVTSEAEAASFVSVTNFIATKPDGTLRGHSLALPDGFLVHVYKETVCDEAIKTEEIYHVSSDGKIALVAEKPNNIEPCNP